MALGAGHPADREPIRFRREPSRERPREEPEREPGLSVRDRLNNRARDERDGPPLARERVERDAPRERPRDADAPGFLDLRLDLDRLARRLRGEPCIDRLIRKTGLTRAEVQRAHTPGAYLDPGTGALSINEGYDPQSDAGILEHLIWDAVRHEVSKRLATRAPATSGAMGSND